MRRSFSHSLSKYVTVLLQAERLLKIVGCREHYTNLSEETSLCGRHHPPPLYLGMVGGSEGVEAGKGRALGGLGGTAWKNGFSPSNMGVLHYFNN